MADKPTPDKPGTYLPIPGQMTPTPDEANAAQIAARNTSASETAATSNDIVVNPLVNDGKLFVSGKPKVNETVVPAISAIIPTTSGGQGPKGDRGAKGDKGDRGDNGPAGEVDYDRLRDLIQSMLDDMLNFKSLKYVNGTPTSVFGTKSITLQVELVDSMANTSTIVTPIWSIASGAATITASGILTGADVQVDTPVTVVANYTDSKNKKYTASTNVLIKALKPASLTVSGSTVLTAGATVTYAATVYYTDGTSKIVTSLGGTTWTLTGSGIGALTANSLKVVASTTSNVSGVIKATYVEGTTSVSGQLTATLAAPVVEGMKPFYGVAVHPTASTTATPSATSADWSTFVNALGNRGTNSSKVNTFTITQGVDQYGWYAYPKSYGLMDQAKIKGNGQPGPGGWDSAGAPNARTGSAWQASGPLEITVTVSGVTTPFYLYRTDNKVASGTFTETWVVSS